MENTVSIETSDFDELAAAAMVWSFELAKLDRSPFVGDLFQWIGDDLVLCRGRFQGRLKQGGHPPLHLRTVAVPAVRDMTMLWRGHEVHGDQFCVFPRGGELAAVSDSRFDMFTISFDEEALRARAERMGVPGVADRLRSAEVFDGDPGQLEGLRRFLARATASARAGVFEGGLFAARFLDDLVGVIAGSAGGRSGARRSARRLQIVNEAEKHLAARAGEPVTVRDLGRAVGVSIRSLQYAFREHLGLGPKAYVNALRLNAVRMELRASPPGTTRVADVANGLGFWHMGQFAADYRRLFGENPSATLARPA